MKRIFLLSFITLSLLDARAQYFQPAFTYDFESEHFYNDEWLVKLNSEGKKIKEITCVSSKHPKDNDYTLLNSMGQVTERKFTNRWGFGSLIFKNQIHRKNEYENGELTKVEYYGPKEELESRFLTEYAFTHRIKHTQSFRKGKKYRESFTDYNADTTQKEYRLYKVKNDQPKLTLKYEYDYYPDKQKKETRQYDRKNKLKYTWKYDCNPKGEVAKKETQVCKNTGLDNKGREVEVTFTTNAKGKKVKTVNVYYTFNGRKIRCAQEYYSIKSGVERKEFDIHFADSIEPYYQHRSYDKKGRLVAERKEEFSMYLRNKQIAKHFTVTFYNKDKISTRWETSYDEKGLPLVSEIFDGKNKTLGKVIYAYQNDDAYSISHYNKKQKLTAVYSGKVTYY
jgi:hypothetical protein